MIRLSQADDDIPGAWFDHVILGQKIRLKVRPRTVEKVQAIRLKHRTFEWVKDETLKDPKTGEALPRMVKTAVYDEEAVYVDVIDWIIEDFEGFGDGEGKPLLATKENKNAVARIAPLPGELSVVEFIGKKADDLALSISEDAESERKN